MPSIKHEGLVQPFQHRPALAPELLVDTLGVKLPDWRHARLGAGELTHLVPTEFRADAVIELYDTNPPASTKRPRPVQAIVLEVQLDKNIRKRYSWPVYLSTLRARHECPTTLLVVCPTAEAPAGAASRSILTVRGIDVTDDARDRIRTCTDLDQLDLWLRHAATADSIDEVFAE